MIKIKNNIFILIVSLLAMFVLSSCGGSCNHLWNDATCDKPQICSICGEVNGSELGHLYLNGRCSRCNLEEPNYVDDIILSKEEIDIIKTAYLEEKKDWYAGLGVSVENFEILYCLGKTENKYVVIIKGDHVAELSISEYQQQYFIYCESLGKILGFSYLPEQISVIYQGVYYTLQESYNLSIISESELIDIFNNFSKINC